MVSVWKYKNLLSQSTTNFINRKAIICCGRSLQGRAWADEAIIKRSTASLTLFPVIKPSLWWTETYSIAAFTCTFYLNRTAKEKENTSNKAEKKINLKKKCSHQHTVSQNSLPCLHKTIFRHSHLCVPKFFYHLIIAFILWLSVFHILN